VRLAPGNIIGTDFLYDVHDFAPYRPDVVINTIIDIFINANIKWSTFNKDDLPLLSYCFYQMFYIVDR
jgi:hypothetical protein